MVERKIHTRELKVGREGDRLDLYALFYFLIVHFQVTMSTHQAKSAKLMVLATHKHKFTLLGPFETIGTNSIKRCKL